MSRDTREYARRYRAWAGELRRHPELHRAGTLLSGTQGRESEPEDYRYCAWGLAAQSQGFRKAFAKEDEEDSWQPGYRTEHGTELCRQYPQGEISERFLPSEPAEVARAAEMVFTSRRVREELEKLGTAAALPELEKLEATEMICLMSDLGPESWPALAAMLDEVALRLEERDGHEN